MTADEIRRGPVKEKPQKIVEAKAQKVSDGDIVVDEETRQMLLNMADCFKKRGWHPYTYEFLLWASREKVVPDATWTSYEQWVENWKEQNHIPEFIRPETIEEPIPEEKSMLDTYNDAIIAQIKERVPPHLQKRAAFWAGVGSGTLAVRGGVAFLKNWFK